MSVSGVYQIVNILNGKRYIGSSVDLRRRHTRHWHLLQKGSHGNPHLQHAWTLYGEDNFAFEHLVICERWELYRIEQALLLMWEPSYNIASAAPASMLNRRHSPETRKKMSLAQMGSNNPWYGRRFAPEHRAKIAQAGIGRKQTPEAIAKTAAAKIGKPRSVETIAKISAACRGRASPMRGKKHSASARAKMSAANLGRSHSQETRAKISKALTGRLFSDEHRANLSETAKRREANKRIGGGAA